MNVERPLRVAIVGSGPAGFYAASALLAAAPPAEVDMLERLPTPWGLVRLGVAPDHPKLKEVSRAFERIAQKPGFRFFGNVELGTVITHDDLTRNYDAVLYAVGAQSDNRLGVPGEELPGSWSATEFVAWYNGHPDFQGLEFDLSAERAVVVGAGNVALDVARMLALTREELAPTDTTDQAIEAISSSGIREIVILARRGPAQAAFTTPELKELGELAGADVIVDPDELELDDASAAAVVGNTNATRNMDVLREFASRAPSDKPRRIVLRFLVSPVALLGEERVEAVEIVRNELVAEAGRISARATEKRETIPAGVVFRSVGYRGVALPGLPFDAKRGTLPNDGGRVLDAEGSSLFGVYCAGWIKRGPSGVIGTNKKDANETVELLLEDVAAGRLPRATEPRDLAEVLAERGGEPVVYAGWEEIDRLEKAAGEPHGRPRVKLASWDDLLAAARVTRTRDAASSGAS